MNRRTTIAGLITAIVVIATWFIGWQFGVVIPSEVTTFVVGILISVIALFADPNSFKEVNTSVFGIIAFLIPIINYALKGLWNIVLPVEAVAAVQAVLIFVFGLFLKDVPNPGGQSISGGTS